MFGEGRDAEQIGVEVVVAEDEGVELYGRIWKAKLSVCNGVYLVKVGDVEAGAGCGVGVSSVVM